MQNKITISAKNNSNNIVDLNIDNRHNSNKVSQHNNLFYEPKNMIDVNNMHKTFFNKNRAKNVKVSNQRKTLKHLYKQEANIQSFF